MLSVELTPHHSSLQAPDSFLLTHIPTLSCCSMLSCPYLSKFSDIVEPAKHLRQASLLLLLIGYMDFNKLLTLSIKLVTLYNKVLLVMLVNAITGN